jgi:hypothetical protein
MVRLQIGTIGKADLAGNHRYPVERLARLLIGQFEVAKAFLWKIEGTVNAPQLALLPGRWSFLRHRGGVDDADHPAAARLRGGGGSKHLTYQQREPVPALTQAIQQRHAGNIDKAHRRRPCRRRSQSPLAQTIGQDQSQQIHRTGDLSRTQERFRLACRNIERCRPAKPRDNVRPIFVHK